jgi:hypothetical protein
VAGLRWIVPMAAGLSLLTGGGTLVQMALVERSGTQ